MATNMPTKTTKPDAAAAVREAASALAAAQAARDELQQRASGTIERPTTRREQHAIIKQTGRAEVVTVDVPAVETEFVGPLGRLQARRALADAEDRVSLAAERLEEAKTTAVVAARAQRTEAIAAGDLVVRAALSGLIADVRKLQERFAVFHEEIARLDAAVGSAYFQPMGACPPFAPGEILDAWCRFVSDAFPPDRR